MVFQGRSRAALWLFWAGMLSPGALHLRLPFVQQRRVRRCLIATAGDKEVEVQVNGDFANMTPVRVEPAGHVELFVGEQHDNTPVA